MSPFFVDPDISLAQTIDKRLYLDDAIYYKIIRDVFPATWQFIGDDSDLSNAGDMVPFDFLESCIAEPLLVTRADDHELYCLSNVCTHRGNKLAYEKCHSPHGITCKYHGRRFDLSGQFKFMPEFKETKNFPCADDHLRKLPIMHWGNMLFTNLTFHIVDYFAPMKERLSWLPLNAFMHQSQFDKDYMVNCNWALYCENYLEGFHIPFVHAGLNAAIDYGSYETILEDKCILQIGYSKKHEDCFELPTTSMDYGKNIAAYYYWVFPNMMFNFYPWGLSINIVKPIAIDKTKVSFFVYIYDESKYNHGAGSDLDKVEMEDEEVVENVQRGIRSRFYQHGRYSPTREQGTHHFHRLIAEALNENWKPNEK